VSRPRKQTVNYFPHMCNHGKTIFILEQKYGNDGYAFWFKLLEMLGSTEGHYLKLENSADWEFLQAKTRLDGDKCEEILGLLAKLGAIDAELWEEQKIVWSDNFVANIADAYRNRTSEIPTKPSFLRQKPRDTDQPSVRNPQTKVNKTKVNKTKVNKNNTRACTREEYTPDFEEFWSSYPRKTEKYAAFKAWKTRRKEGVPAADLTAASKHYADYCAAKGTETQYIKHAKTFLGPMHPYREWIRAPDPAETMDAPKAWHTLKPYLEEG